MDRWWISDESEARPFDLVTGVFKGGGARGVAYAGALIAMKERRRWFSAVAGASAGAITAALIAAGTQPDDLDRATEEALSKVTTRLKRALVFGGTTHDAAPLRRWLDDHLRRQLGCTHDRPVTFAELAEASGIDLFVVAMDLYTRAPVIFCAGLTPSVDVASAVLASCAIPGAIESGRAVVSVDGGLAIDQLVDGGAYANFPQFIFASSNFQAWYANQLQGGSEAPRERYRVWRHHPTYGFVLDDELNRDQVPISVLIDPSKRFGVALDRGTSSSSGSAGEWALSEIVGSHPGRFAIAAGVLAIVGASAWATPRVVRGFSVWAWAWAGPLWPIPAVSGALLLIVATASVLVVGLALVALGRVLSTTVVPAARAALGVATGVPPWVGSRLLQSESAARTDPDAPTEPADWGGRGLTVLRVPSEPLTTLSFKVDKDRRVEVVTAATAAVSDQLAGNAVDLPVPPPRRASRGGDAIRTIGLAAGVVAALFLSLWLVMEAEEHVGWLRAGLAAASVMGGVIALVVLYFLLRRGAARANLRSVEPADPTRRRRAAGKIAAGVSVAGVAVVLIGFLGERSRNDMEVRTVAVAENGTDEQLRYGLEINGADRVVGAAEARLRIGERVIVARTGEDTEQGARAVSKALPFVDPYSSMLVWASTLTCMLAVGIGMVLSGAKDVALRKHRQMADSAIASAAHTSPGVTTMAPAPGAAPAAVGAR